MLPLFLALQLFISPAPDSPILVNVKVFPHLTNYPPQGKDADPNRVTLKSSAACKIFRGDRNKPISTGVLLEHMPSLSLHLTASNFDEPFWIECAGPIEVVRIAATENYLYRGPLYVHTQIADNNSKNIEIIHPLLLNNYLKGVVAVEMPFYWPKEALKAQAVAARSYAVFHLQFARESETHPFYDVDDTVFYQAFTGINDEKPEADEAIAETGNTVLTYEDRAIQAYFSADSGGYTEDASRVWPVLAPYCVAKKEIFQDPEYDQGKWGPWTLSLTLADVNDKLLSAGLIANANPVVGLEVPNTLKDITGRAISVRLHFKDGATHDLDGLEFRRALCLKSTMIDIKVNDDASVEMSGKGYGHGVGMSQYGARVLAQQNSWDYSQILNFYYTDIRFCDLKRPMVPCTRNP